MEHKESNYTLKHLPEDFIVEEIPDYKVQTSGSYAIFLLIKKGMTTLDAIVEISKLLKISSRLIRYAGLKDAKAVTKQYISIPSSHGFKPEYSTENFSLKHIGFLNDALYIGKLQGNLFTITLRNIDHTPEPITRMINYFGVQRFSSNNHLIGKCILKKEYSQALVYLQGQSNLTLPTTENLLAMHKQEAFALLIKQDHSLLRLCLSAYQSYLWNSMVYEFVHQPPVSFEFRSAHKENGVGKLSQKDSSDSMPMIGFGLDPSEPHYTLVQKMLKKEGLSERDFILPQMPNFGLEGAMRKIHVEIKNMHVGSLEKDNFHLGKHKCQVSFTLSKGCYATECVKQMLHDKKIAGIDDFSYKKKEIELDE